MHLFYFFYSKFIYMPCCSQKGLKAVYKNTYSKIK